MNSKLLLLSGKKTLLRKNEKFLIEEKLGLKLINLNSTMIAINGKAFYKIPVLVLKNNLDGYKGSEIKVLLTTLEKKLNKYSIIRETAYTEIDGFYVLNKDLKVYLLRKGSDKPPSCEERSIENNLKLTTIEKKLSKKPELIIEINKGGYYKKEIEEYGIEEQVVVISELDRIEKPGRKFPFSYGSLRGIPSTDGDYADCFIISKNKDLKEGKKFLIKRKKIQDSNKKGKTIRTVIGNKKITYYLVAVMVTTDKAGKDPKFIFSDLPENTSFIKESVELINNSYKEWKKKEYNCEEIITDYIASEKYINNLRKN